MRNKSVIISSVLMVVLIVAVAFNAYYINRVSTELLDMLFALPSEYGHITSLEEAELEGFKSDINIIAVTWEKNSPRICAVTRYSDFERVNSAVYGLREYFFSGNYSQYLTERRKLITALEKQKNNEMPNFENIF